MFKKIRSFLSSIQLRVTLWYALFIMVLMGVLIFTSMNLTTYFMDQEKRAAINRIADRIEKGDLDLEDVDESYFVVELDSDNELTDGAFPAGVKTTLQPHIGRTFKVKGSNKDYLVTDRRIDYDDWIRVYVAIGESTQANKILTGLLIFFSPFVLLLIVGGGGWILWRAFRPVRKMAKTAEKIIASGDLSQRIPVQKKSDELNLLALQFNELLERMERMLEREKQLTNDLSHEIRTPLTTIMAESEFGLRYADDLDESKDSFQMVQNESKRIKGMIEQILDYSRTESKQHELAGLDFSGLVKERAKSYVLLAQEKGLTFEARLEPGLLIDGDQILLERLLDNLFSNALKFARKEIKLVLTASSDKIVLSMQNDGPLIEASQQAKIWDRFYQIDQDRNQIKQEGIGLGLSFVKQIATIHSADLDLISTESHPTEFFLYFPKK